MRRILMMGLTLAVAASCPSCGGGARERTVQRQLVFGAVPTKTGILTRLQDGGGDTFVPSVDTSIRIGDTASNNQTKGFVSFDISSLPEGAQITYAVMHVTQEFVSGIPYGVLGPAIFVDQVDVGADLDESDWDGNALGIGIGTLAIEPVLRTFDVEVTQEVAFAMSLNRSTVDFRMSFENATDADNTPDQAEFTKPGELAQPVLEVMADVPNR